MATNTSFEDAGAGQGEADGWTTTTTGDAQGYAAIEAGDGLLYAEEQFDGWVAGQAEYRAAFEGSDVTAAPTETFAAWESGQDEYRLEGFTSADTTAGTTETFETWVSGQADYRAAFQGGDVTAGSVEAFVAWVAGQADYRAAFDLGDTSTGTFRLGASATGAAETFEGVRTDVVVVATPSDDVLSAPGISDFFADDPVRWETTGTPPAPFKVGVTYYASPDVDQIQLAATVGGPFITPTDAGTGVHKIIGDERYFWRNPRSAW